MEYKNTQSTTFSYYIDVILGQAHTQQNSTEIFLGPFWKLKTNNGEREIENHIGGDPCTFSQ